jgi:SAM-dependent methyltransferase
MDLNQTKSDAIDAVLEEYLEDLRAGDDEKTATTLGYTHSLHRFWRQVLRMLPVAPGSSVLDAGSGLGLLPFELAANVVLRVEGSDLDPNFIEHSRVLQGRLADAGVLDRDADISFSVGDVCALDFADASFDLVFIREVLQFLPDPVQALRELLRVLKPGGYACVSDMDDGLRITWPPPSPPLARLVDVVADLQHEGGGDRHVGRKLTTYLRSVGFGINSIVVLPEAQHRLVDGADNERVLILEQLHAARLRVLAADTGDVDSFDRDLAELESEDPFEEFRLTARLVVLAQRSAV